MACHTQLPWSFFHVVLVAFLLFQAGCLGQTGAQYQKFDPCTPYDYNPVNIGNDYVIGIAYWPGGLWEDWCVDFALFTLLNLQHTSHLLEYLQECNTARGYSQYSIAKPMFGFKCHLYRHE